MENIYVVICSWTETDPFSENFGKKEWDIVSSDPTSFEKATQIKNSTRETWLKSQLSRPIGEQNLTNVESVITINQLEELLKNEQ
jgi:hypothetical protein